MRRVFFLLGIAVIFFISCKRDNNEISVKGLYTENSPIAGRSQLNFINGSIVIKSETGSSYKDTFNYKLSAGKIQLTPAWTNQYSPQEFDFEKIDDNTIKIQNLYPSIPEAPKSYMTFKSKF